jgi:farnesyl-diphosphate farnesyltransferase
MTPAPADSHPLSRRDLETRVLADVSRTFFLTIRVLPGALREPIGLAYLLARATDTIADSSSVPAATRLRHLASLKRMIASASHDEAANLICRDIQPDHPGERELIRNLPGCLGWLGELDPADRKDIIETLEKITRGQSLDIERFGSRHGIHALRTAAQLDEYTYLVAGCVGEFWTHVCARHVRGYAKRDTEEMTDLGVRFGKGLQLVNILRDLPADLAAGRCYLPEDELKNAGIEPAGLAASREKARRVVERWLDIAQDHLDHAQVYIEALKAGRPRYACVLPWYLGVRTLALLRQTPPLESKERIKVSRSDVRKTMVRALPAAWSDGALRKLADEMTTRAGSQ